MPQPTIMNRALSYGGVGTRITIPTEIWDQSLAVLREYGLSRSEGLVLWGGVVNACGAYVTGLYLPRHVPQGVRAVLTRDESRWLLRRMRDRDEKLLAQFHSHPSEAYHSGGDDHGATSFHAGFFSIVAPDFGVDVDHPSQCAVFEYDGRSFRELGEQVVCERVRLVPLIEDRLPSTPTVEKTTWLRTIVSNLKRKLTAKKKH